MSVEKRESLQSRIGISAGLSGASWAVIQTLWSTETVSTPIYAALLVIPIALFCLVVRDIVFLKRTGSVALPIWRYNRDFMISMVCYVTGIMIAIGIWDSEADVSKYAWAIALLPIMPTLAMIYVMGRYLSEENDEFLRQRAVMSALIGLGCVLVVGTFWGFMETFGVVPHVWAWWVVPVWAIGLGLGQIWLSWRDEDDEPLEQY